MLKGKNILITGTNRGIGKAILEKCVENGASVWAHARRETPDFIKLVSDLSVKHQIEIRPVYFDMTDKEAVKKAIISIRSSKLPVDALINNAGIMHNASFQMSGEKALRDIFETDFFAPFFLNANDFKSDGSSKTRQYRQHSFYGGIGRESRKSDIWFGQGGFNRDVARYRQ